MKKTLSVLLIFAFLLSLGISAAFAEDPIVIPPSGGTETGGESDSPSGESPEPTASPEATASPEVTPSPTPQNTKPVITKDPYNENISTGGKAVFIAHADNATSVTWYIVSPDGASTMLASSIPQMFPGINVSGTDTDTLVILDVTTRISGYKAFARFGNEHGFQDTATATVTVSAAAPTPTPTAKPTSTPAATPTVQPTSEPESTPPLPATPVPVVTPTPAVTPRSSSHEDDYQTSSRVGVSFGTILLLVLCLAVIAGAAVVLSMYVKGTIDLSWLEKLFTKGEDSGGKSDDGFDDGLDVPDSFYDPDDFNDKKK